ncbi:MAG: Uma2 family endonuclease [Caldilineaceae bacterium]
MKVAEQLQEPQAEPAWEIAHLFPLQGEWSVDDYLALETNQLVEYANGHVEVLPMPSPRHQDIVFFLQRMIWNFIAGRKLGKVLAAPLPIELWPKKYREPDLIFIFTHKLDQQAATHWREVDLVMEVVSPDNPSRDYKTKRREYAQAGIPEYWIVDPQQEVITVLELHGTQYQLHGEFKAGQAATSVLLAGFTVAVTDVFDVA